MWPEFWEICDGLNIWDPRDDDEVDQMWTRLFHVC